MKKVLVAIASVLVFSCGPGKTTAEKPTLVSLNPGATEMIFALGAQDHLLAVSDYCDYPAQARQMPKVGDLVKPNIEAIISMDPDYVVIFLPTQARLQQELHNAGLETLDISPESPDEVLNCIEKLGHLLKKQDRARQLVDSLQREMEILVPPDKKPLVVVELSINPVYVAGANTFPGELVSLAGGENAFEDVRGYKPIQDEEIMRRKPDIVIMAHNGPAPSQRLGWNDPKPKELRLDPDLLTRPGPRFALAARTLNQQFRSWSAQQR